MDLRAKHVALTAGLGIGVVVLSACWLAERAARMRADAEAAASRASAAEDHPRSDTVKVPAPVVAEPPVPSKQAAK